MRDERARAMCLAQRKAPRFGVAAVEFALVAPRHPGATRRAAAVAELAICLPLLTMLILASIEACTMIFLDHSLTISSYEGVRVAINFDGTNAAVLARCNQIIDHRSIEDATVSINPANVATVPRGQPIAITVTAPCDPNAIIPPWFYGGRTLSATTTMVKE
jgi:TadE-like protein